jgi:hypothetical protein
MPGKNPPSVIHLWRITVLSLWVFVRANRGSLSIALVEDHPDGRINDCKRIQNKSVPYLTMEIEDGRKVLYWHLWMVL